MKIKKYPQYKLYKFTKLLNYNKEKFQKSYTGKRAVNGTIVNRAITVLIPMLCYG